MAYALKRWTGTVDETLLVAGDQPTFRVDTFAGSAANLSGLIPARARRPSVVSRQAVWMEVDIASGQRVSAPYQINARVDGVDVPLNNAPDITVRTRLYFYSPSWKNRPLRAFSIGTTGYIPGAAGTTVEIPGEPVVQPPLSPNAPYYYPTAFQERRQIPGTGWEPWRNAPGFDVGPDSEMFYAARYPAATLALILSACDPGGLTYQVRNLSWATTRADANGRTRNDSPVIRWVPPRTETSGGTNGVLAIRLQVGYFA